MSDRFHITPLIVLTILLMPSLQAEDSPPVQPSTQNAQQPGWLGVWVRPLSAELRAQLAPLISFDEGLLVDQVEKNSPAEKSGIRKHDVLLSFAGQKLYSAEQLSSLVQNFNANSNVELTVIQQGQLKTLNSTLSGAKRKILARTHRPPHRYFPRRPVPAPPPPMRPSAWDQFESVEVKTLPDGRYRAVVSYKDDSRETKTFTFEGHKSEIVKQIEQLQELPEDKKRALLSALNLRPEKPYGADRFDNLSRWLWNSPLLDRSPFEHPFFNDPNYRDPWQGSPGYPPWHLHLYPDGKPRYPRP